MRIEFSEFKADIDKYLALAQDEDIFLTDNNGNIMLKLSKATAVDAISGILANKGIDDIDRATIKEERLRKYLQSD